MMCHVKRHQQGSFSYTTDQKEVSQREMPCHPGSIASTKYLVLQRMILGGLHGGYQAAADQLNKPNPQPLQAETGISAQVFM